MVSDVFAYFETTAHVFFSLWIGDDCRPERMAFSDAKFFI